jgi:ADP-heptose:LPS heptosyltransferase
MKINLMRFLDKNAGVPLCVFLAFLLFLKRTLLPIGKTISPLDAPSEIKNILIIKFFGSGSIFLAWPLLKGVRKRFPNARIHIITFDSSREFLEILQCVDVILPIRKDTLLHFTKDILGHFHYFLKNRIDISIDLEFFSKFSVILSMFYLSMNRVGLYSRNAYRGNLLTYNVNFNHYRHISEVFYELGKCIGIEFREDFFQLRLPSFEKVFEQKLKSTYGLEDGKKYIVVNINSSDLCPARKWPLNCYMKLIKNIRSRYPDRKIMLIGAESERPYVSKLYKMYGNENDGLFNLAGKTDGRELLALLEHAELVVSNDSGPAHFTSGYNTPLIVLFGPETPLLYKPMGSQVSVIYRNLYCSPCVNVYDNKSFLECEHCLCMKEIQVSEVMEAVDNILVPQKAR